MVFAKAKNMFKKLKQVEDIVLQLVQLFSDSDISRKKALSLIRLFSTFTNNVISIGCDSEVLNLAVNTVAGSEHTIFKKLAENNKLFLPEEKILSYKGVLKNTSKGVDYVHEKFTTQLLPISKQLKTFFDDTQIVDEILDYVKFLDHSFFLENMIQTEAWRTW